MSCGGSQRLEVVVGGDINSSAVHGQEKDFTT
jgi:hypothetical protein